MLPHIGQPATVEESCVPAACPIRWSAGARSGNSRTDRQAWLPGQTSWEVPARRSDKEAVRRQESIEAS